MIQFRLYTSRQHSSTSDEDSDSSIDKKLKQCAKRNKLTPQNVKNILQVSQILVNYCLVPKVVVNMFVRFPLIFVFLFVCLINSIESGTK